MLNEEGLFLLDGFQGEVGDWAANTFPGSTLEGILSHLSDEVSELEEAANENGSLDAFSMETADCFILLLQYCHRQNLNLSSLAMGRFEAWTENLLKAKMRPDDTFCVAKKLRRHVDALVLNRQVEPVADLYLSLLYTAHRNGFCLMEAARQKLRINQARVWGKPDVRGVIHHLDTMAGIQEEVGIAS